MVNFRIGKKIFKNQTYQLIQLICLILIISGCKENTYKKAVDAFEKCQFEKSIIYFNTLPENYKERELYVNTILACNYFNNNNWFQATEIFDNLNKQMNKAWISDKSKDNEWFKTKFINAVYQELNIDINSKSNHDILSYINPVGTGMDLTTTNSKEYFFFNLYTESLFRFYEEETNKGIDISKLEKYRYSPSSKQVGSHMKILYAKRLKALEADIVKNNLAEYYSRKDNLKIPYNVTGNCIYINIDDDIINNVKYLFPPLYIADRCESVRYVFNSSESSSLYTYYSDGTKGYAKTFNYYIKDVITGEIILKKTYKIAPPYSKSGNNDVYAGWTSQSDFNYIFLRDFLPILINIFPIYTEFLRNWDQSIPEGWRFLNP